MPSEGVQNRGIAALLSQTSRSLPCDPDYLSIWNVRMGEDDNVEFGRFITDRRTDLKRIAAATKGEHQLSDVENVAWLMAHDMHSTRGVVIDFPDRDYQQRLLSHVFQELVRYTETQVRYALRLDHGWMDDDGDGVHPLMCTLVSNDGRDRLAELMALETAYLQSRDADSYSLAGAYAYLLRQFDNKVRAVADYLLISASEVRRRCADAVLLAQHQCPVPINHASEAGFRLKAWRQFRFQRIPIQLELALLFDEELPLLHQGMGQTTLPFLQ